MKLAVFAKNITFYCFGSISKGNDDILVKKCALETIISLFSNFHSQKKYYHCFGKQMLPAIVRKGKVICA
jgi:hypothetical protein